MNPLLALLGLSSLVSYLLFRWEMKDDKEPTPARLSLLEAAIIIVVLLPLFLGALQSPAGAKTGSKPA